MLSSALTPTRRRRRLKGAPSLFPPSPLRSSLAGASARAAAHPLWTTSDVSWRRGGRGGRVPVGRARIEPDVSATRESATRESVSRGVPSWSRRRGHRKGGAHGAHCTRASEVARTRESGVGVAHATWIRVGRRTQLHYRPCPVVEKSCGSCTTVTQVSAVTTLMFFPE